ncbi:hypothetical protein [Nocardia niwae]|uniref:hypothetical protein n=1 Tax=Nocardia niwae TaxID=626084 RepID=UPI0033C6DA71
MALIPITIRTPKHGPVTVTGDQVTPHFAIVPVITTHDDGTLGFADHGQALTHIPTGLAVTFDGLIDQRRYAAVLEELPIDWAGLTQLTNEQRTRIREAHLSMWTEPSDGLPWPKWAGDESTPALSLIVHQLDDELDNDKHRRQMRDALEKQVAAHDPELGRTVHGHLLMSRVVETVNSYAVVYLLAVLIRIDPAAADRAARHLAMSLEHSDNVGEWLYQWRQEIAVGMPVQLPGGFSDLLTTV